MKYRGVKPSHQKPTNRKSKLHPPPSPTLLSDTDAGPRPLSHRQQVTQSGRVTGEDIIDRVAPRRAKPAVPPPGLRARTRRDAEMTHVRRRRKWINRRKVDYLSLLLRSAAAVLCIEVVVALLFSPRFYVTKTTVEGNATISSTELLNQLAIGNAQNIVRLPVGRLRKAILAANPMIESAEIHRGLPGTVQLVVRERLPWASAYLPDGSWYTIDKNLVPFRVSAQPEKGLPRLRIAQSPVAGSAQAATVELGKPLTTPGLDSVSRWLAWAYAHNFPIASIEIAPDGKLCLNRTGNLQVQVGTEMDLDKKTKSLSTLLENRPDLRTCTDIAYINVFAYDAPAILPRALAGVDLRHQSLNGSRLPVPPGDTIRASDSPTASGPSQVLGDSQ